MINKNNISITKNNIVPRYSLFLIIFIIIFSIKLIMCDSNNELIMTPNTKGIQYISRFFTYSKLFR